MLNAIIAFSLHNRMLILIVSVVVVFFGGYQLTQMPVDVFPDLNRPTVAVMTEAAGLAPEEVEVLVTRPIEYLLNGATGVQRVRSASGIGLSIVWVEFDWGTDIYRDRQIVSEKLQLARERLPQGTNPVMAPISSIMGEIMLLGLRLRDDSELDATTIPRPHDRPSAEAVSAEREQRFQKQAMELRTLAEFTLRNRLLAIEGVSQVTVMGGILKQYQIVTSPPRLAAQNVTLLQLTEAAKKANVLTGGGIMVRSPSESLMRISGQSLTLEELENTPVVWRDPRAILIKDVADVRFGGPIKRGDGSVQVKMLDEVTLRQQIAEQVAIAQRESQPHSHAETATDGHTDAEPHDAVSDTHPEVPPSQIVGGSAVMMTVQKQPNADTLKLDAEIDRVLDELQRDLPSEFVIERRIFKQSDFIRAAVNNVVEAVRDGAVWVVIILFLFMWNLRTSIASLTAMPMSILLTVLVFHWFGISINTMTLGGIAVAIGDLVDDSIVDIENIFRRLNENRLRSVPENAIKVIYDASCEVRNSIVYATMIVILVVFPIFSMGGLEGRMFAPLGLAYITSLLASLAVSLTLTPVLGYYLLARNDRCGQKNRAAGTVSTALERDPFLLRWMKSGTKVILHYTLRHANLILVITSVLVAVSVSSIFWMGGEFLPPFNEGTLTISVQAEPGTSLEESQRLAQRAEQLILRVPEVLSVSRRTGRAELDEHAEGVNSSEIDVRLVEHERSKPGVIYATLRLIPIAHLWSYETLGRPREQVLADIRDKITAIPSVKVNIGQPISHRLDHIMSGVRAQIAVKVFGQDLRELRDASQDAFGLMSKIPGVVDLQLEPQVEISQIRLKVRREAAARYGLAPGDISELLETAYKGQVVSQVLDDDRYFGLVVWYDEESRNNPEVINETILDTPSGRKVSLGEVVDVLDTSGPNTLNREHVQRRIVVSCNVQGRDLAGVIAEIQTTLKPVEEHLRTLPGEYHIEYGGQFEAQQQANLRLLVLGSLSVVGVFILLWKCLESWRAALQVLVNIPLAAMGSVITLLIVNHPTSAALAAVPWWQWPQVWVQATSLTVAHWVGFITLIGVVSRNGIMMISHYIHLMKYEGEKFNQAMIIRGSLERLAPVMMTASASFIGLLPLLFGAGQTGKEILYPLALVVFGGMLTSTILDQIVTPALFFKFGRKVYEHPVPTEQALDVPVPANAAVTPTEPPSSQRCDTKNDTGKETNSKPANGP
jgi:Cu/Ag efflux pump CusA